MTIKPFPTAEASDRIIERQMETAGTRAAIGDVVIFCTDDVDDVWTAQPVGLVDDRGEVLAIRTSDDELVSIRKLAAFGTFFVTAADRFKPGEMTAFIFREYRGLVAVQQAGRPLLRQ